MDAMAVSTTTFEERISRIQERAATGENHGFVEPGTATDAPAKPKRKKRKARSGYLMSALGGLMMSFVIVGAGTAFMLTDLGAKTFETFAGSMLHSDN